MKKYLVRFAIIVASFYLLICVFLYFFQEKIIFLPNKLDKNYSFQFDEPFEELNFAVKDGKVLNGLLFKADSTKGCLFYMHGNAGNLASWGKIAQTYTKLNYDIFIFDYRGYGKSEGEITNEEQLFEDHQIIYDEIKKRYNEKNIIIVGYSIGTGFASKLASTNQPNYLLLQAPYYCLTDLMKRTYRIVPTFLLNYKLATHDYLKKCAMPIFLFHGDHDEIIDYNSSLMLQKEFKSGDTLVTLKGQGHNRMTDNKDYQAALKIILAQ